MLKPIFIWQEKILRRLDPTKIKYVESEKNYVYFYLTDDISYMVRSTLMNAYKKLPSEMFIKVNRSLVVSIYYIDGITTDELYIVEEINFFKGESIPKEETVAKTEFKLKGEIGFKQEKKSIGRQYYKPLLAKLNKV